MGIRSFCFYLLYAVAALVFFLVLLFPGERAAQYLTRKLNDGFQYGEISISKIAPSFPPAGVKATRIRLNLNGPGKQPKTGIHQSTKAPGRIVLNQPLDIQSLSFFPRISTLHKETKRLGFNALAFNGTATGTLDLHPLSFQAEPSYISLDMNLSGMEVNQLKHRMEGFDIYLSFKVNADITYEGFIRKMEESLGKAKMSLSQCVVQSDNPFLQQMNISEVTFTTVGIGVEKEKSVVKIERFDADGPEMKISLNGNIILKKPVEASLLKLNGKVLPDASRLSSLAGFSALSMLFTGSGKGIPFKIAGTLRQPRVHL